MAASKPEWLVIIPDHEGKLGERVRIRPKHLEKLTPSIECGTVLFGGAMLDKPLKDGEAAKMKGSVMLITAETEEKALEWVKNDVYTKEGVWDVSKIQIMPFRTAVRKELKN